AACARDTHERAFRLLESSFVLRALCRARAGVPAMRAHHLNCISTCPLGGSLMDGRSMGLRGRLACHCLLLEAANELVLVDTGFGTRDVHAPRPRLSGFFLTLLAPDFREGMTAIRQVQR